MRGLFMSLPPFSPDYSGVGAALLELDAMIVILCCLVVGLVDLAMELRSNRKVVA